LLPLKPNQELRAVAEVIKGKGCRCYTSEENEKAGVSG